MLYCKKNVRFGKFFKTALLILDFLRGLSEVLKKDIWITSANDSNHRIGSAHFKDKAFDIRTRNLSMSEFADITGGLNAYNAKLILFEWHQTIEGEKIYYKARFENDNFFSQFQVYLNCKNSSKVSHLHVEW